MTTPLLKNQSFLADSLNRKVIFFTGKGGVGKTALAWATARALSRQNRKVGLISLSSFESESDDLALMGFGIPWHRLEPLACFKEYALKTLKFERIFESLFENRILKAFVQVAPGLSDTIVAGKIWDLYAMGEYDTLIVDLPATGHALSFFKSPMGIEKMFGSGFVHRHASNICGMFTGPDTRLDIVTLPEEMPLVESSQFVDHISTLGKFPLGFLLVNQCTPHFPLASVRPDKLPRGIQNCLSDHRFQLAREKKALQLVSHLPLTLKQIPRFTGEILKKTIEQIVEQLESDGPNVGEKPF